MASLFSSEQDIKYNFVASISNESSNDIANEIKHKNIYLSNEKLLIKSYNEYSNKGIIENTKQNTDYNSIKDEKVISDFKLTDKSDLRKENGMILKEPDEGSNISNNGSENSLKLKSSHIKEQSDIEIHEKNISPKLEYKNEIEILNEVNFNPEVKKDYKEQKDIPIIDRKTLFVGVLVSLARKRLRSV